MVDALAATDAVENRGFLILPFQWNQNSDGLADDFFGEVAENPFRTLVPARDEAIKVLADDCVVAGFNDGGEPAGLLSRSPNAVSMRARSMRSAA